MIGCQRIPLTEVRDIFIFRIYLCQYIYALSYQYCMYFLITAFVGWYTVHIWVFVCVCCAAPDKLTSLPPFTGLGALHRRSVEFRIDLLPESTPISMPTYRTAPAEKDELEKQIMELYRLGII